MDIILSVLTGVLTSLIGGITLTKAFEEFSKKTLNKNKSESYSDRLAKLNAVLSKLSKEYDAVIKDMALVTKEREENINKLENGLSKLMAREKELNDKIQILQNVPIPVANQFAKLIESGEKRSAKRDYVLFLFGVVITTIITIVLKLIFGI